MQAINADNAYQRSKVLVNQAMGVEGPIDYDVAARELGLGPPRRIPTALARLIAGPNAVAAVVRSARSSNAKLKRELGWRPRYPSAEEGVPATIAALAA